MVVAICLLHQVNGNWVLETEGYARSGKTNMGFPATNIITPPPTFPDYADGELCLIGTPTYDEDGNHVGYGEQCNLDHCYRHCYGKIAIVADAMWGTGGTDNIVDRVKDTHFLKGIFLNSNGETVLQKGRGATIGLIYQDILTQDIEDILEVLSTTSCVEPAYTFCDDDEILKAKAGESTTCGRIAGLWAPVYEHPWECSHEPIVVSMTTRPLDPESGEIEEIFNVYKNNYDKCHNVWDGDANINVQTDDTQVGRADGTNCNSYATDDGLTWFTGISKTNLIDWNMW